MAKEYFSYNSRGDYIACTGGTNRPPCRVVKTAAQIRATGAGTGWIGTVGKLPANTNQPSGKRLVVLAGTMVLNSTLQGEAYAREEITDILREDNFEVVNVSARPQSSYSWILNVQIECNVFSNHTAEQVRQRASYLLSNAKNLVGGYLFNNVNLKVVSDFKTTTNAPTNPNPTTPGNNPSLPPGNNPNSPNGCDTSTLFGTLACIGGTYAESQKYAVPIALGIGAITLIVLLKK